jgi:hypothetical protein
MQPIFLIQSYQRQVNLKRIIKLLKARQLHYVIFDDGSDFQLDDPNFIQHEHRGKPGFWRTWKDMFKWLERRTQYSHFIFLQDDCTDIQLDRILDIVKQMKRQDVYHLYNDGRDSCWLQREPTPYNDQFRQVYWVDCVFICHRWLLNQLGYGIVAVKPARFERNPNISSGVGQQLTLRLRRINCRIFQPHFGQSLCNHGKMPSLMNPDARNKNNLKTF